MNRFPATLRGVVASALVAAIATGCREGQKTNLLKRATDVGGAAGARENPGASHRKPVTVTTERAP